MTNATGPNAGYANEYDPITLSSGPRPRRANPFAGTATSPGSILWNWVAEQDMQYFTVNNATGIVSPVLSTSTLNWMETGLLPNTSYFASVVAHNPIGNTNSNSYIRFTQANIPTGIGVVARSSYSITLAWQPNGNPAPATQYEINCSTQFSFQNSFENWPTTSYVVIPNLDPNQTYYFQIKAHNGDGLDLGWSSIVSTITAPVYNPPFTSVVFPMDGGFYKSLGAGIFGTAFAVNPATITAVQVSIVILLTASIITAQVVGWSRVRHSG